MKNFPVDMENISQNMKNHQTCRSTLVVENPSLAAFFLKKELEIIKKNEKSEFDFENDKN